MRDLTRRQFGFAAVGAAVAAAGLSACSADKPTDSELDAALAAYTGALARQDAAAAAEVTTSPGQARPMLEAALFGMSAEAVRSTVAEAVPFSDGTASVKLTTEWDLGRGNVWTVETSGSARKVSPGWRVTWDPQLIAPGLAAGGRITSTPVDVRVPKLLGGDRKELMTLLPVRDVVVTPRGLDVPATARRLSVALRSVAPGLTAQTLEASITGAGARPVRVASIRESDWPALTADPARIGGVSVIEGKRLVVADQRNTSPALAGVREVWEGHRAEHAGWEVTVLNPGVAARRIGFGNGTRAPDLTSTLRLDAQLAVAEAVVAVAQPAAMLVLDPATGAILAAGQNPRADELGQISIAGTMPIGDVLDPVVAAAGAVRGTDPRDALARGGIGVDYAVPGLLASGKQNGPVAPAAQRISVTSGDLRAGTLNMAVLAAALATGKAPTPYIVAGEKTTASGGEPGTLDPAVRDAGLRAMRAAVADGDASDLRPKDGMLALVGTSGPQGPGWFLGTYGGRALAVYCAEEKSGTAALAVVARYLKSL